MSEGRIANVVCQSCRGNNGPEIIHVIAVDFFEIRVFFDDFFANQSPNGTTNDGNFQTVGQTRVNEIGFR